MISGAQAIVKCLEKHGIEYIFGYPGVAICPLYDSLFDSKIKHILVRHEQHAGHNASGYARISGKPTVCLTTSGPGATNLITALATAYTDSIPMIAITGQVTKKLIGTDSFQEADVFGCTQPFVKHSYMVMDANNIVNTINEAFHIANTGRKGPVLIDIPMDVQTQMIEEHSSKAVDILGYKVPTYADEDMIKKAVSALKKAKRPLICVGGGVHLSNSKKLVIEFCEKTNIPAIATMMGIGTFPTLHENYFGMLGSHGKSYTNKAMLEADTLIILGARVGNRAFANPKVINKNKVVIHVDIDPAEIGKNAQAEIALIGDIACVLKQLNEYNFDLDTKEWFNTLNKYKSEYKFDFDERENTLNPKAFVRMLSNAMEDDSIYCADVGQNQIWSSNNVNMRTGRFLTSGGMGTMGYAIPVAIGAKIAAPKNQVVAVCGDGSFQMSMSELATIVQYNIPVKIVVMKNHYLGMVREAQDKMYESRISGVDLGGDIIDISMLAKAYGIKAEKVHNLTQAKSAINNMLKSENVYLLECFVDSKETSL